MSVWILLKVFSDVCVCFAILGAMPAVFVYEFSLLWPAMLCGLGAGIAAFLTDSGKMRLRWLGMLPPLISFALVHSWAEGMILLPVIGYTGAVILPGRLSLEYYSYRTYLKRSLTLVSAFYLLIYGLSYMESALDPVDKTFAPQVALYFGIIHAIVGVILLRQLRLGGEEDGQGKAMNRRQAAVVLGGTGAAVLGFVAAERFLHESAVSILQKLALLMLSPFLMLYEFILHLMNQVINDYTEESIAEGTLPPPETYPVIAVPEAVPQPVQRNSGESFPWLMLIALVFLVVMMVYMIRTFRAQSGSSGSAEILEKVTEEQPREKKPPRGSSRGRVRRAYREYLKAEKKRGVKLHTNQTSADILQEAAENARPQAAQLREIYLAARYDDRAEITREQAEAAKAAVKRIRGES